MYRLIACDLDETLLDDERRISPENLDAIRKARSRGVKFVPATGRGYVTVQSTLKDLGVWNAEEEYVISLNGGAITENRGNRLLETHGISYDLAHQLFEAGLNYPVCIHVYTLEHVYIYQMNLEEAAYIKGRMEGIIELTDEDISFLRKEPLMKVLFQSPDALLLRRIEEELKPITDQEVAVSFSSGRYIEFNRLGVTKGGGLLHLAELLGIKQEETIAIGDNFNDLPMILDAGLGVCVANGVPEVKEQSDYICMNSNNQHAISEVIHKFILN